MFLKVINKVNFKLFLITDLLQIAELLELLAINHSLSERGIVFILWFLTFFHVLVVL